MAATVVAYSIDTFAKLLQDYSEATKAIIDEKLASNYFKDYFDSVDVKTIVVENPYIDHDYLDDFSAYYVKCYHNYKRFCVRLHFFGEWFDGKTFSEYLQGNTPAFAGALVGSYRGFLVVRPLPRSIIGRTCLVHYPDDGGRRHFPAGILCRANLFGLPLSVTTVPFQEQDTVTAACATSALWTLFQVTGSKFQHWLPSPVEITSSATRQMPLKSRAFPNADGLTIEQMAGAIRSVGLEPYYIDATNRSIAKAAIHAYVSSGIPALLLFQLQGELGGNLTPIGGHATAVTGYSIPDSGPCEAIGTTKLKSGRIDKIYAHDDQVGPYARMEFVPLAGMPYGLTTSWGLGGQYSNVHAVPIAFLFPLYNKIRLPFSVPLGDVLRFDGVLQAVAKTVPDVPEMEWDLRLLTVADLRRDITEWKNLPPRDRERLLTSSLPRFIWAATARKGPERQIDIVFDATDIDSGLYIRLIHFHDQSIYDVINYIKTTASNTAGELNLVLSKLDSREM